MFTFNLNSMVQVLSPKKAKQKYFEPLFNSKFENYYPPSPGEIRKTVEKLSRCSNCHFLIFDNYWGNEIEKASIKVCPTCGYKI